MQNHFARAFRLIQSVVCLLFAMILLFGSGCTSNQAVFSYPPRAGMRESEKMIVFTDVPPNRPTLGVVKFSDERGFKASNWLWVSWIPFVPFGGCYADRIESFYPHYFPLGMEGDLTRAAAISLSHSRLFSNVHICEEGESAEGFDYTLTARVMRMDYARSYWVYCMMKVCVVAWVLGAPINSSRTVLQMQLILRDRNGHVVWSWLTPGGRDTKRLAQGLYYNNREVYRMISPLFRNEMNDALEDLKVFLETQCYR
ncbi:MAG: hypothetical protein IKR48_03210 [Kiritimatiellae bacterium]|nr:hypothetical protein [Kiritimatiellia bacterium]